MPLNKLVPPRVRTSGRSGAEREGMIEIGTMADEEILAYAMGLGKTIMTIPLFLAYSKRGGSLDSPSTSGAFIENSNNDGISDESLTFLSKETKFFGFDNLVKRKNSLIGDGNLIACPTKLLGQWKVHILRSILTFLFNFFHNTPKWMCQDYSEMVFI
ncbi:hypothetical protein RHSIM_Rhsim08G0142000 [Rhododendron simsii]|uniref:SNF2 N-terminal domain-containing protein n=1 Tax=Rhododendron simsii TaxID=118357 RepID=A0A834GI08_RHOSS|nr:hypothetical protein RHSIM_Rhsim08G0142000 [Rhododendron simsii]